MLDMYLLCPLRVQDIDRPLVVTRMQYGRNDYTPGYHLWQTFTVIPLWNARRQPDNGLFGDGGYRNCEQAGGTSWCVQVPFPLGWYAYERASIQLLGWHGTLFEDKAEKNGSLFRRNRYYDPGTGRFTQEDPIGLAGGLNLYGFAGGDPVNFSDPFGLMTCPPMCPGATAGAGVSAGSAAVGAGALAGSAVLALPLIKDTYDDPNTYVTYTRTNATTGQVYVGRTSGQAPAHQLVANRARNHPDYLEGFGPPVINKVAYGNEAYSAIRGREQQLIDSHGGIGSPGVANKIRAVAKLNPMGPSFHTASNMLFGELAPYTGGLRFLLR